MPVGIVVVSHSAALAAAAGELAREMAGDGLRLALAGGIDDESAPLGTDATKVMAAVEEVDDEAGVLVLMDLGSAVLSAELARDLLPPEIAARVLLCEAPIVEGLVAAAVQAAAGAPLEDVVAEARAGLSAKADHLGVDLGALASAGTAADEDGGEVGDAQTLRITVPNALGFHARPAARIVEALAGLDVEVAVTDLTTGQGPARARSLNALITLGARQGDTLELSATGSDAAAALDRLAGLVEDNLGDPPDDEVAARRAAAEDQALGRSATGAAAGAVKGADAGAGAGAGAGADAGPAAASATGQPGVLGGLSAAPGIAIGPVHPLGAAGLPSREELLSAATAQGEQHAGAGAQQDSHAGPPERDAAATDADTERARLAQAIAAVHALLRSSRDELARRAGRAAAEMVGTQLLLLDDPDLLAAAEAQIEAEGHDAATAFATAAEAALDHYTALEDPYLVARAADLDAVAREVLAELAGVARGAVEPEGVVVARDLSPAEAGRLDPDRVDAVVTAVGSPTSHAALIARALGIPAVVALGAEVMTLEPGTQVVVDGDTGRVETVVDDARAAAVREQVAARAATHAQLRAQAVGHVRTVDGLAVEVQANVGLPRDAALALREGADGVGMLRTEFLFLDRPDAPDEEEQVATYTRICTAMEGRPVTLRTLDVGGDKPLDYIRLPEEHNPFLGTRGIRLSLAEPALLRTQLRAALRVAATHPIQLMLPMVAVLEEITAVRELVAELSVQLRAEGHPVPERLPLGVMAEVPALALKARHLIGEVDTVSIGTNDLTQYTLAAERGNPAVAAIGDHLDPGVLALIGLIGSAALGSATRVAVCGDLASDPAVAGLLIGLGVRELSVPPRDVPAVKQAVREVTLADARQLADAALACRGPAEVRALLAR